jgi:hypothetical protein
MSAISKHSCCVDDSGKIRWPAAEADVDVVILELDPRNFLNVAKIREPFFES